MKAKRCHTQKRLIVFPYRGDGAIHQIEMRMKVMFAVRDLIG